MNKKKIYRTLEKNLEDPKLKRLYDCVRTEYSGLKISHNWEHIIRVTLNSVWLGESEGADLGTVLPAALLHDIGFINHPTEPKKHNEYGAVECVSYLSDWSAQERSRISSCILRHKGKYPGYQGLEPQSLEEKVLCDADQIDKFGWMGLLQVIKVYDEYGMLEYKNFDTLRGLSEGIEEASHIELYTESAKKIAEARKRPSYAAVSKAIRSELSFYEGWRQ